MKDSQLLRSLIDVSLPCRSRTGQQGRLLCPKLVVVKTEPKEEESSNSYQIKPDQTKAYQTRPSANKSGKSSSRKALESCLLSSSKVRDQYLRYCSINILNIPNILKQRKISIFLKRSCSLLSINSTLQRQIFPNSKKYFSTDIAI